MAVMNLYEARTNLSRLMDEAAQGRETIIGKAGKPLAKLVPVEPPVRAPRKLGMFEGQLHIPDRFDAMFAKEIQSMFRDGPLVEPPPDESGA